MTLVSQLHSGAPLLSAEAVPELLPVERSTSVNECTRWASDTP